MVFIDGTVTIIDSSKETFFTIGGRTFRVTDHTEFCWRDTGPEQFTYDDWENNPIYYISQELM